MSHFVAYILQFQEIIVSKIPPGGGGGSIASLRSNIKLKTLALIEAKKLETEIFFGEKGKWTDKGNDKQQHADSLFHNTTSHTQHLDQMSQS